VILATDWSVVGIGLGALLAVVVAVVKALVDRYRA
jgi:hypothetical protein